MTTKPASKLKLPRHLLWEYDYEEFDYDKAAIIAITRVIRYGDIPEWQVIKDYYGVKKIKKLIKNTKLITPRERAFADLFLDSSFIK